MDSSCKSGRRWQAMQPRQSGPALVPWEVELQKPLRSADLRAALHVTCLLKHFDMAISTISLSSPALRAPKLPWLWDIKGCISLEAAKSPLCQYPRGLRWLILQPPLAAPLLAQAMHTSQHLHPFVAARAPSSTTSVGTSGDAGAKMDLLSQIDANCHHASSF